MTLFSNPLSSCRSVVASIALLVGSGCVPEGECTKVNDDGSVSVVLDCGKAAADDTGGVDSDTAPHTGDTDTGGETGITPVDNDGDGHASTETGGDDCDDDNVNVYPGAAEVCDGIDNDCDGESDEDSVFVDYYVDSDGDGYGDGAAMNVCEDPGAGYSTVSGDCDDADDTVHPYADEACDDTVDLNCDGSAGSEDLDGDGSLACDDCDDTNSASFPDNAEVCDGVDNDCDIDVDEDATDMLTWYADSDGDTYGDPDSTELACDAPTGHVENGNDCDDTDGDTNPAAAEVCDGIDNDCDGESDEDSVFVDYYVDADGDGYGDGAAMNVCEDPGAGYSTVSGDCDDSEVSAHPGGTEVCDSADVDEDCNGVAEDAATGLTTWHPDVDRDGYGDADGTVDACNAPSGYITTASGYEDCDDTDSAINVAATESCDGQDNDCDGDVDESGATGESTWYADSDGDGYGNAASSKLGCTQPSGYVEDDTDCDDGDAGANPGATEIVSDGIDQDCDGVDSTEPDVDSDGYGESVDCDDGDAGINPGATESCDGVDEDCDGSADNGLSTTDYFVDSDGDGYGDSATGSPECADPGTGYSAVDGDCDDGDSGINPGETESCDGQDNDCDGDVDESGASGEGTWYADSDSDGYGDAVVTQDACDAPSGYVGDDSDCDDGDSGINPGETEIEGDGIDQDCDGLETFYSEDFGAGTGSCTVGDFVRSDGGTVRQSGSCHVLIQEGGTTTAPSVSIDVSLTGMSIGVDYTFTWEVANEYSSSVTIVADADRGTPDTGTFALGDSGTLETTWTADATSVTARIWTTGTSYYDGVLTGFVVTQE